MGREILNQGSFDLACLLGFRRDYYLLQVEIRQSLHICWLFNIDWKTNTTSKTPIRALRELAVLSAGLASLARKVQGA
jgi:hypothetical protein